MKNVLVAKLQKYILLCFRDQLPSPQDLKRKILIKAKKLPPGKDETFEDEEDDENEDEDDERRKKLSKVSSNNDDDICT